MPSSWSNQLGTSNQKLDTILLRLEICKTYFAGKLAYLRQSSIPQVSLLPYLYTTVSFSHKLEGTKGTKPAKGPKD